ncbi:alpha/beta hydrolase [Radiobacillus deserti]|uniref:Alpha/beta hydrolase n=1 Tax=Radiobacillus deserti TaxID=2594883 RepID=A0A516KG62_9BACI|nr:alpha/beta hydrolase [Radiobacillus deserti]QDP40393.1 alpha/beta hydrolase [Radiobacillus deserti]
MEHFFQKGTNSDAPTLLILHGTGGTEKDLLPIAEMIDSTASVLGVRGTVSENGMARFFRRLREGVFDEEDLIERTKELHEFLDEAASQYGFDRKRIVAIGYSNGANIAGSLLFHYTASLQGAILFHPMVPRRNITLPNLSGVPVFIGAGENDPLCLPQETIDLESLLTEAHADVTVHWDQLGHQLSQKEVNEAKIWYNTIIKK